MTREDLRKELRDEFINLIYPKKAGTNISFELFKTVHKNTYIEWLENELLKYKNQDIQGFNIGDGF